ncbi:Flowering time control protein FPA [Cardamine amara subsp. amara]|uniref:Flowering time control protein FPA n=1 Tax=Cardamine amara subsp. amara TaxID=228776 RepID=A0ABD0ZJD4_CARAN
MSARGGGGRERMMMKEERGRNPPSRHLWVGNLPHGIPERELADRFIRFGELESLAFQPGRSYAFLNFKRDEDAFAAIESLQGFSLAGNPLRIEFAKADKSSTESRTEDIYRHDEQRSAARGSPFVQRNSRMRYESPDTYSKPKVNDRNAEPSEVLYIGFPASLKVDDALLRKVFSSFGEITKVTVFPGRSYAFVQFRNLISACNAKEALQGKLFGNPRVHICFAKSEPSSSNSGRGPSSRSLSPSYRSSVDRLGSSEGYLQDRNYGSMSRIPSVRKPHYMGDRDLEDSEDYMFNRKAASRRDGGPAYGRLRSQDMHEYRASPREMGSAFRDDPHRFPSRSSVYEEPWDLSEEDYYYQETKRQKTRSVQPERQFPEQERRPFSRGSADFSPKDAFERNYETGQLRYKQTVDQPLNLAIRNGGKSSLREPHDELMGSYSVVPDKKRYTPELNRPSLKDWNWEGTIAKGGNPICRAKCFPVGKVMDMMLPEFLDCTARTGLDMLAKHYYQSSKAWVVFFVPGSDTDIVFYNEFMHYLEEKQRAAVSKLDDTTTLFLVPPSDFSEKVLKVPGKLSISGVILRLEYGGSGSGPIQQQGERKDTDLLTYYGETSYAEASGAFPDVGNQQIPNPTTFLRSGARDVQSSSIDPYIESKHDQLSHRDWPPRDRNTRSSQMQPFIDHNTVQEHSGFIHGKQPNADLNRYHDTETSNQPERYAPEARASLSHLQHVQTPNIPQLVSPGNQNVQLGSSNSQQEEETEANPQKCLQATLQLAAALLQQIQQTKPS